jgi:hypothetical protein
MIKSFKSLNGVANETIVLGDQFGGDIQILEDGSATFTSLSYPKVTVTSDIDFSGKNLINIGNLQSATSTSASTVN